MAMGDSRLWAHKQSQPLSLCILAGRREHTCVAQGDFSPALRAALVTRESQIGQITARLLESRPDSLRVKLGDIRGFVFRHMRDIRAILGTLSAFSRNPHQVPKENEITYCFSFKRTSCTLIATVTKSPKSQDPQAPA
jgi:hypothetical protein